MAQGLDGDKFVQGAFLNTDDGCRELLGGCHDSVCSHDLWDQDGMVDEAKGVGDAFATGVGHDHLNSAIMMFCMQQILSFGGVVFPYALALRLHVDKDFRAHRGHWCGIEEKQPMECFACREKGVLTTRTNNVQGDITLRGEAAPFGNGE